MMAEPEPQEVVWPVPTQEQLDRAESLVRHPRRLLYFLERLDNPFWLAPLAARGWFDAERLPEPAVDDAGTAQISDWPPAEYLARVAGSVPEAAEGIIEAIGGTTNPLVQRHLVTALLALPPQRAATFVGAVVSWIRGPHAAWLDERDLTSLTTAFLQLADTDAGEVLALTLLNAVHDEYVLGEVAHALSQPLAESGPASVGVFADALDQRADANHHLDLVSFRRSSIGAHRENQHLEGDTDPLIDGLRDAALDYTRRTGQPDVMNELLSRPDAIYRRIAYHVATAVINEFGVDAPEAHVGPADSLAALRARGRDCVMKRCRADGRVHPAGVRPACPHNAPLPLYCRAGDVSRLGARGSGIERRRSTTLDCTRRRLERRRRWRVRRPVARGAACLVRPRRGSCTASEDRGRARSARH